MQYLLAFLEGVITFISPCLLPMLPIYISYFVITSYSIHYTKLYDARDDICYADYNSGKKIPDMFHKSSTTF